MTNSVRARSGSASDAAPFYGGAVYPVRRARPSDVPAIVTLLDDFARRGMVLPRTSEEVFRHVREFVVADDDLGIAGCASLRLYSVTLAEVAAVAVAERCHGRGVGRRLVGATLAEARELGVRRVFALTLQEGFFHRLGFRTVSLAEFPEAIDGDRAERVRRTSRAKAIVVREIEC